MGGGPKRVGGWPGGPVVCRQWVGAFIQREMLIVCLKLKSTLYTVQDSKSWKKNKGLGENLNNT